MTSTPAPTARQGHIAEFEGLRGLLAAWVFAFHLLAICGLWSALPGRLVRLLDGAHAVDVFIILSGFVIALLVRSRPEPYRRFVARRFLRLFPAYAVCLAVSSALGLLGVMPLQTGEGPVNFARHAAAHMAMLHGSIPESVLPGASGSILNPAWSISTEWQFYLLAPLVLTGLTARPVAAWAVLLTLAALGPHLAKLGGWDRAFVFTKLPLFALGIGSYFTLRWVERDGEKLKPAAPYLAVTAAASVLFVPYAWHFGVVVWLVALSSLAAARLGGGSPADAIVGFVLRSRCLRFLGMVSYSLYLSHEICVWVAKYTLERVAPDLGRVPLLVAVTSSSVPATLLLSMGLYRFVERPAMRYGKSRVGSVADSAAQPVLGRTG